MENKIITKNFKKSQLNARENYEFSQITRKNNYLLDSTYEISEEGYNFSFEIKDENYWNNIKTKSVLVKMRALINIEQIVDIAKTLDFSLNPKNLFYDINYIPKILIRDVYSENEYNEEKFVKQYKSLIGATLQNKMNFEDFYLGGMSLLNKNKITAKYTNLNTIDEIVNTLKNEYLEMEKKVNNEIIEINKNKFVRIKIYTRIATIFSLFAVVLGVYFGYFKLTDSNTEGVAVSKFLTKNYSDVIITLKNSNPDNLSKSAKYMLSESEVRTIKMEDEQRENSLKEISPETDDKTLLFWIFLAQEKFDAAISQAATLGGDSYLILAYSAKYEYLMNDRTLSSEEREKQKNEAESKKKELESKYEETFKEKETQKGTKN